MTSGALTSTTRGGLISMARGALVSTALCWIGLAGGGTPASADVLFGSDTESGGFGGPRVQLTSLNGRFAALLGGHGGWVINHRLVLGGAGYGLINDVKVAASAPEPDLPLQFGWGGLFVQYIFRPDPIVHGTAHLTLGGGGASFEDPGFFEDLEDSGDAFFAAESGAGLEINVSDSVRLAIDGGFRFVSGVDLPGLDDIDLMGPSLSLGVKIGTF